MLTPRRAIKILLIILPILIASLWLINRGRKVNSIKYDVMLKTLLDHSVEEIGVSEMDKHPHAILLDSRSKSEYDVSHIKDAVWVGFEEFTERIVQDIDKEQKIVVYCSVGYRSEKISEKLRQLGYNDVSNLYGGIFEWINEEKIVVDDAARQSSRQHVGRAARILD